MVTARQIRWIRYVLVVVQCGLVAGMSLLVHRLVADRDTLVLAPETQASAATPPNDTLEDRPLSWFAPIWQRDLRRPPVDPVVKNPRKNKPIKKPEPLRLTLLGTVVEPDARYAVFRNGDGHIVVKRLHDEIDRYTIARIDRGRAELVQGTQTVAVTVPGYETLKLENVR